MRVLIATIGSEGDVQPFFALARRFMAEGHVVRVASGSRFAPRAQALGVPFTPIGAPWDDEAMRAVFARVLAERSPLAQLREVVAHSVADEERALPTLQALARDVDVVVYQPILVAAAVAARVAGTPHVSVHLAPLHKAVSYGPTGANLGAPLNKLGWYLAGRMLARTTDAPLNRIVAAGGLPPWRDILLSESHSPLLDLIAVSPEVLPRDPGLGPASRTTGYFFLDEPTFVPDRALEAFVAAAPPVVVGFGSMMGVDARAMTEQVLEFARRSGKPVVLQSGWAGLGDGELPANVFRAGFVPHAWLHARAACVVHHGGAGTTASALRAGVPQAVVHHLGDQPVWGRYVEKLGVGPRAIPFRSFRASWLDKTVERLTTAASYRENARRLATKIGLEDGTGVAVKAIENVVATVKTSAQQTYSGLETLHA